MLIKSETQLAFQTVSGILLLCTRYLCSPFVKGYADVLILWFLFHVVVSSGKHNWGAIT